MVSALVLAGLSHTFDAIPQIGSYLATILSSFGVLTAGAALMIVMRNAYLRFRP
jgi:hypothetical protein